MFEVMGAFSVRDRVEQVLERLSDPALDGTLACPTVYVETARAAADAADRRRANGVSLGRLDGVLITIKDLFDVAGEVTRAGSVALATEGTVAHSDAFAVRRLRAGGAVVIAKTGMSEFAFSGVGENPHFGTPRNPLDLSRLPGGSSAGAAVSVARDFCDLAIGTDTGGSLRIPAALCGLVGFKPTQSRVPRTGAYPLSSTLDCVGPIARTVTDCEAADEVLSGRGETKFRPAALQSLRVGILQGMVLDGLDREVAAGFDFALACLKDASVSLADVVVPAVEGMRQVNGRGGLVAAEAFELHEHRLAGAVAIDPNISARIERGRTIGAKDYIYTLRERQRLLGEWEESVSEFDVLVMPTVPILAPTFRQISTPEGFQERNALLLRNTSIGNFFDVPAISLTLGPRHPMVGLTLIGRHSMDLRLLSIARAVERALEAASIET